MHLGVDLGDVVTKASLADAFALALRRIGAEASGDGVPGGAAAGAGATPNGRAGRRGRPAPRFSSSSSSSSGGR